MKYKKVFACGDSHGNIEQLEQVLSRIPFTDDDLLVFLGDYIDRGDNSIECLKLVMDLSKKENVVVLRGNHEQMMLEFFDSGFSYNNYKDIWLSNGGDKTFEEIKNLPKGEFKKIYDFVETLPIKFELDNFFFCHAGVNPKNTFNNQYEDDMLWIREKFLFGYDMDKIVVIGHTPTQCMVEDRNIPIKLKNNIIMCDTGSFLDNGKVSCVEVLSGKFFQSDLRK